MSDKRGNTTVAVSHEDYAKLKACSERTGWGVGKIAAMALRAFDLDNLPTRESVVAELIERSKKEKP